MNKLAPEFRDGRHIVISANLIGTQYLQIHHVGGLGNITIDPESIMDFIDYLIQVKLTLDKLNKKE